MPVIAAKLASIVAGFIVNFAMSHFVVFRPKPSGETRL
jgi:putative flippase GtrA